ncbi:hypothetical protein Pyn_33999 [Prunus yedoensis var. nudiflora]|uniref:Uncharacterized protein n=1 Tax=Prunus yedoensis var. nudiflora TaxID=2094558 RepID=A0A314ZM83_PRUYE|nr:hypothetical protein Pyn_33999 [Prunus yedoensis var. nudiflora]
MSQGRKLKEVAVDVDKRRELPSQYCFWRNLGWGAAQPALNVETPLLVIICYFFFWTKIICYLGMEFFVCLSAFEIEGSKRDQVEGLMEDT